MARAGRAQLSAADRGAPSAQPRPPPPLPPPPPPPGREFFPFSKWRPMPVAPPDDVIPLRLLRRTFSVMPSRSGDVGTAALSFLISSGKSLHFSPLRKKDTFSFMKQS
ncbi:uncharacterized protein LOC127694739 [Apodemus sylvaticus]|uniref:uncharacterized protein LOC127694739 n=1 Tax=Apodemus sylvaticus TaxID=10129 RepID=UPI0022418E10|nr:uncharacterized protein LOC127694739 [Apodemus sylvaticus]